MLGLSRNEYVKSVENTGDKNEKKDLTDKTQKRLS
jgi:hypothetical protein